MSAVNFARRERIARAGIFFSSGGTVDFVYVAAIAALLVLTLGLVAGCAALERK
jgi:hypothetical protein